MRTESFSSIQTFFQCPRKYFLKYIEKIESKKKFKEAEKGKNIHKIIETDQAISKDHEYFSPVAFARENLARSQKSTGIVRDLSSFTSFSLKIRDNNPIVEKKELEFGLSIGCSPVPFLDPAALFRGKIDLVRLGLSKKNILKEIKRNKEIFKKGENQSIFLDLGNSVISCSLRDWKTGKYRSGRKQLNWYSVFFFARYKNLETIDCQNIFVSEKKKSPLWIVSREEAKIFWIQIKDQIQEIRKTKTFPVKKSPLCGWCEFENTKNCQAGKAGDSLCF